MSPVPERGVTVPGDGETREVEGAALLVLWGTALPGQPLSASSAKSS